MKNTRFLAKSDWPILKKLKNNRILKDNSV